MESPFETLGVAPDADDNEIKQAYLQQVKLNPPDRDQQRFQHIHSAYQSIKDTQSRLKYALFNHRQFEFDELLDQAFARSDTLQLSPQQLNTLLSTGLDEIGTRKT